MTLDAAAAEQAIREQIAEPLGITKTAAALAIVRIANEKMAGAIRAVSVDKGYDPRKFALVGFGGAGPMHIVELAKTVGARTVLIPPYPGALSAYGCLIADAKYDYVTAVNATLDSGLEQEVHRILSMQRATGCELLQADGFAESAVTVEHVAEMSFSKQRYSVQVPLGDQETGWEAEQLMELFLAQYATAYGGRTPSRSIKLVNLRTAVTGVRFLAAHSGRTRAQVSETTRREITFDDMTVPVDVLSRDSLTPILAPNGSAGVGRGR